MERGGPVHDRNLTEYFENFTKIKKKYNSVRFTILGICLFNKYYNKFKRNLKVKSICFDDNTKSL